MGRAGLRLSNAVMTIGGHAAARCYLGPMPRRGDGSAAAAAVLHLWPPVLRRLLARPAARVAVLSALLVAVFVALLYNDQPALAVALYALIPIVLSVYWFELAGGLLTATAAMLAFLVDVLITPSGLTGAYLGVAAFNRAVVFFGIAGLVALLLRRERALVHQVREQRAELDELESLRAALTPSKVKARPHLQVATSFVPADGVLAGDFFLVVDGPSGSTTIVVGDVVGHGLEAARCAAFVRAALLTFARFTSDPAELLQLANAALVERDEGSSHFVTAVCLNVGAPSDRSVRWAAAGHEAPWFLDSGTPLPGGRVGAPLGISADALKIEAGQTSLEPGAGLLVYTDGLIEGRSARRTAPRPLELFGEERARSLVRELRGAPVGPVLEALSAAVTSFAGGPLADDLCLVAVRARCPTGDGVASFVA